MNHSAPTSPNRSGFTLIEMLVVMGILTLLAVLTIPAVTKGIEKAKATKSQTTLEQWAKGMTQYLEESPGGRFPEAGHMQTDPDNMNAWYNAIPETLGFKGISALKTEGTPFPRPGDTQSLFICVAATKMDPSIGANDPYSSYGYNQWVHVPNRATVQGGNTRFPDLMRVANVEDMENFVIFGQHAGSSQGTMNYDTMVFRHGRGKKAKSFVAFATGTTRGYEQGEPAITTPNDKSIARYLVWDPE